MTSHVKFDHHAIYFYVIIYIFEEKNVKPTKFFDTTIAKFNIKFVYMQLLNVPSKCLLTVVSNPRKTTIVG